MKKIAVFATLCVIVLAAVAAYRYKTHIYPELSLMKNISGTGSFASTIVREISTGGALRAMFDAPNSHLTGEGVLNWTNSHREELGLSPLVLNDKLSLAAQNKVEDMFKNGYFEHISPSGKGPDYLAQAVGYEYAIIGENLALGNYKDDQALVKAWMDSPGHRANILNARYSEIGIWVGEGMFENKKVWLAVQEFGKPASKCPAIDENKKSQIESYKSEAVGLEFQIQQAKLELDSFSEPQSQAELDAYNEKVRAYNSLVKFYNNKLDIIKQLTESYNLEVRAFNECVKK